MPTVDFIIVDHCNKNCKLCNHYSNYAQPHCITEQELDLQISSVKKMNKNWDVLIIGGEPLLHPNLCSVIKSIRKGLPKNKLLLYTNGIITPSENVLQTVRECRVEVIESIYFSKITKYPNTLFKTLDKKNKFIEIKLNERASAVNKKNYKSCDWHNFCFTLRYSKLYTCPIMQCVQHKDKKTGSRFEDLLKQDYDFYDFLNSKISFDEWLKRERPFCLHCYSDFRRNKPST